jgi:hypothetical protein
MSDAAVTLEVAPPPDVEAIAKMSSSQLTAYWDRQRADAAYGAKLTSGDGNAQKILRAYVERKDQLATAESLIDAAADPNTPLPRDGGANNKSGMSKRDEVVGVQWQLEGGASLEEVAEFEVGEAMVPPEDFHNLERQVNARCINNPEFTKRYLAGDPEARAIMDRWHRIAVTSRPLPPMPTTGIAK